MIRLKSDKDIILMRESCNIAKACMQKLSKSIKKGMSTKELDKIAFDFITGCGARPSCLGYKGYPSSICASIDNVVIHGIPGDNIIIKEGQLLSIDLSVYYKGFHSDIARTFLVGCVSDDKKLLAETAEKCFFEGIKDIKAGNFTGDIGNNIESYANKFGFSVVRTFAGHGVGFELHEDPVVSNYGKRGSGARLKSGMTLAVEPMINMGGHEVEVAKDGWTVTTKDGFPSAHYENTVLITESGIEILTL